MQHHPSKVSTNYKIWAELVISQGLSTGAILHSKAELILGGYSQWHPRMIMQTRDLDISQKREHTKSWHLSVYTHVSPTCHRVFFFGDSSSFWSSITDVFWKKRTSITSAFYSVTISCSTSITKKQINWTDKIHFPSERNSQRLLATKPEYYK